MSVGEVRQFAWWLSGHETTDDLAAFAVGAREAMDAMSEAEGITFGPTTTVTLHPGDDHVPEVPDHIQGPDVRLLVVEAPVVGHVPGVKPSRFTDDLGPDDLGRLRRITRDAYARRFPVRALLTDRQCETIINDLGPEAAADAMTRGMADIGKVLH